METNNLASFENIQSATAILLLFLVLIIFYGLLDSWISHKEAKKKERLEQEISYLEEIEFFKHELAQQELYNNELVANNVIIPKGKRQIRKDWIELPDEGACLQALPAPIGEWNV